MFNLADYETVEVRLEKFIKDYKDFRIATELEVCDKDRYVVKAYLYKVATDLVAWTTGLAEEKVTDRGVNSTSALENCETSAIGRALANAGYAAKGKRPSQEEMKKVVATKVVKPPVQDLVPDQQDYWTTPVNDYMKLVDAPVTLYKAMENVAAIIGTGEAQEAPQCKHGHMTWREGDKNGRAWGGYFCSVVNHGGGEPKCNTVWYGLSSEGKFVPQKARG